MVDPDAASIALGISLQDAGRAISHRLAGCRAIEMFRDVMLSALDLLRSVTLGDAGGTVDDGWLRSLCVG